MNTSESIDKLAAALNKAQSQMTGAVKSAKNPFFKSNYSDLASVCEAISKPFADNGLCYVQSPEFSDGGVLVVTRIMHISGQWIEGTVSLPPTKNDAQGYGSAITYGRRYGLQAMAGIPSVDDDGQAAVDKKVEPKKELSVNKASMLATANAILNCVQSGSLDDIVEIWLECTADEKSYLWTAKSKGGFFTQEEKTTIRGVINPTGDKQ